MITGLPSDMRGIQESGHRVVPHIYTRPPVGGSWVELQVIDATVTYAAAGDVPGRTINAVVLLETTGLINVTESIDDVSVSWSKAPLSPFGSWLKAEQWVYRLDGTFIVIPWGIYRVDSLKIDELTATVTIDGSDATSQIQDRPFVTVAQGRVTASQMIGARMSQMIGEVFTGGIPSWWDSLLDLSGLTDRAFGGKGANYADSRNDALKVLCAKLASGWTLIAPRQGSVLKAVQPGSQTRGVAYVQAARNLIFPQFADTVDREGLFNEVVVTYEVTQPDTYGRNRIQQRRAIAQYVDAGEELAANGPFGYVTRETVQVDIPAGTANPDQYAKDLAYATIGKSFSYSRTINLQCGPIYGLEQGDAVYVQVDPSTNGIRKLATLVGATIPLRADGGPWTLDLLMSETLDPGWKPRYYTIVDQTQYENSFDWADLKPVQTVDLDEGTAALASGQTKRDWRGWTVDNQKKLVGGVTLTATSNGGQVAFRTSQGAWSEASAEHRYLVKASVTAAKGAMSARIGIDTNTQGIFWSDWVSFQAGKGHTVQLDSGTKINPNAVTFGIQVQFSGMSNGEEARLNGVSVEKAVRSKS